MKDLATAILLLIVFFIYFLPSFVGRKKKNASAIFILNFFFGWSIIGWVVALIWAVTKEDLNLKKCPECAEEVKVEAQICRFCNYEFPKKEGTQGDAWKNFEKKYINTPK